MFFKFLLDGFNNLLLFTVLRASQTFSKLVYTRKDIKVYLPPWKLGLEKFAHFSHVQ